MAINVQTLQTRSLTAAVFVVVMLAGLFVNGYTFLGLFMLILLGSVYEFFKLLSRIVPGKVLLYSPLVLLYIVLPIACITDLGFRHQFQLHNFTNADTIAQYAPLFPCAVLFSIWINDTMAYIVGSMIGKTPFSSISPKKTWEGTIGGAVLCILVIGLLGALIPVAKEVAWYHWVAIASIAAIMGTLGDLLESKLKRMAGVKDSGSFMPGHGGFLDRFDSLLVATPFIWLYLKLFL